MEKFYHFQKISFLTKVLGFLIVLNLSFFSFVFAAFIEEVYFRGLVAKDNEIEKIKIFRNNNKVIASRGLVFKNKDEMSTPSFTEAVIQFPKVDLKNIRIYVMPNSKISFIDINNKVFLDSGKVYFELDGSYKIKRGEYSILTENMEGLAEGTKFIMESAKNESIKSSITVVDGTVRIRSPKLLWEEQLIKPNFKATVIGESKPKIETVSLEETKKIKNFYKDKRTIKKKHPIPSIKKDEIDSSEYKEETILPPEKRFESINLLGVQLEDAKIALKYSCFSIGKISYLNSNEEEPCIVVGQVPNAYEYVECNEKINLTVIMEKFEKKDINSQTLLYYIYREGQKEFKVEKTPKSHNRMRPSPIINFVRPFYYIKKVERITFGSTGFKSKIYFVCMPGTIFRFNKNNMKIDLISGIIFLKIGKTNNTNLGDSILDDRNFKIFSIFKDDMPTEDDVSLMIKKENCYSSVTVLSGKIKIQSDGKAINSHELSVNDEFFVDAFGNFEKREIQNKNERNDLISWMNEFSEIIKNYDPTFGKHFEINFINNETKLEPPILKILP
jgi:hypothetical protein